MKVVAANVYLVTIGGRRPVLVELLTDEGIRGVGDASVAYGAGATAAAGMVKDLVETFVLGKDPFRIEAIWSEMYDHSFWAKGGGPIVFAGMSAIEQALWDIKGKALEVPVYEMLGGKLRERVRVYANGWSFRCSTPDEFARAAERVVKDGYTALKLYPLASPDPTNPHGFLRHVSLRSLGREAEELAVARVRAVRDAVGPEVDLLLDMSAELTTDAIIRIGRRVEEFDIFFFEEPVDPFDVAALKKVSEQVRIPIAVGERLYTRYGFRPVMESHAADILQPDIGNTGGIMGDHGGKEDRRHGGGVQHAHSAAYVFQPGGDGSGAAARCLHLQLPHPGALSLSHSGTFSDRGSRAGVGCPRWVPSDPGPARAGGGVGGGARAPLFVG